MILDQHTAKGQNAADSFNITVDIFTKKNSIKQNDWTLRQFVNVNVNVNVEETSSHYINIEETSSRAVESESLKVGKSQIKSEKSDLIFYQTLNITKGRTVCFWIWLWFWFGVGAFVCDKEEEDCQEHPHDGNWTV